MKRTLLAFVLAFLAVPAPLLPAGTDSRDSSRAAVSQSASTEQGPTVSSKAVRRPDLAEELQPWAAIGSEMARNSRLCEMGLSEAQRDAFVAGVRAALYGDPYPSDEATKVLFAELGRRVSIIEGELRARQYAEPGGLEAYMKTTCEKYKLQRADSGMGYGIMAGSGSIRPSFEDTVVFSMAATADDGETAIPQLTTERMRARVADLMPGLAEGLQMMTLDAQAMFILPPEMSFGSGSWPEGVVRGTPVILIVKLHEIMSPEIDP